MSCKGMDFWTFTGLVGAFLDLFIAYFLLCASTIAFFASKLLGFFGLSLPFPSNGLFGIPSSNNCVHSLLVDYPTDKISSVQLSVRSKFPFDSILVKNQISNVNMDLNRDRDENCNVNNGFGEFEGEASCSSNTTRSDARKNSQNVVWRENGNDVGFGEEWEFDRKGKGVVNHRPRGGFRRRRNGTIDNGKLFSASSHNWIKFAAEQQVIHQSPCSIHKEQNEKIESSSMIDWANSSNYLEFNQPGDESETDERFASIVNEPICEDQDNLGFYADKQNTIRVLEQELEEEHAARAALYLELEKERNAASTAADEAMAMILRLQEEKASKEMEARQYQRILEEKSAYDAEEMDILKEIVLRREREKHFLEKEVEAYRQMIYGNEQLEDDDQTEDPNLMLQQLSVSIGKKKLLTDRSLGITKEDLDKQFSQVSEFITNGNEELQEKEIVSVDDNPQPKDGKVIDTYLKSYSLRTQETTLPEKTISVVGEEQGENTNCCFCNEGAKKNIHTHDETGMDNEIDRTRSSSDMSFGRPPMSSRGTSLVSELRRNSMSALDNERTKIDTEVEWLRERLRIVQEGREKLNLSKEHGEREKLQLQLLEDITRQLREIRLRTEPVKARQVSLPLPSSKGMPKKRRRSVSLGLQKSS